MITPVRPRALVHRGSIESAGLLVACKPLGADEARRRIVAAWRSGARVWAVEEAFVIVWPEARRLRAENATGAPLLVHRRAFLAVPLTPTELDALGPPPDTVVMARGGEAIALALEQEIDPASWIDIDAVALEHGTALTEPITQTIRAPEAASEARVEQALRATVGEAPAPRADVMKAIAGASQPIISATGGAEGVPGGVGFIAAIAAIAAALIGVLLAPFVRGSASPKQAAGTSRGLAVHRAPPPSAADALGTRLQRFIRHIAARTLMRLRLARFVGRWHAEYLAKMLDLFERGDLDDALRHAIPLGDEPGQQAQPALLPPKPRDALALTAGARRATAIGVMGDLYADLRQRYRKAFDELDREGDVERAAFVLAELLRVTAEAVAYLEKHKRFALAAELAEARGLSPEYAVRLWFRAGQKRRAITLARRHDCFAVAIERLERDDRDAAASLRLAWADACASAGDYVAAAQVARRVGQARELVRGWIERALELGGPAAATASVLKLEIEPEAFDEVRDRMQVTLEDRSPLAQPAKHALYASLRASDAPGASVLARAALRAALADRRRVPRPLIEGLASKAGDPSLRLHALRPPTLQRATLPPGPGESSPLLHQRETSGASGLGVSDAAMVAGGRLLVALGELGVRLLSLDGRMLARFDAPASALVVSSRGDRSLAVMPRDGALEVARIDVVRRRVQRWGLLTAGAFARNFDGATWFVARGGEILALDATVDDFDATWGTKMQEGRVTALHCSNRWLLAVSDGPGPTLAESFELPGLTLRHRREIEDAVAGLGCLTVEGSERVYRGFEPSLDLRTLCSEREPLTDVDVDLAEGAWCVRGQRGDGCFVVRSGIFVPGAPAVETSVCVLDATTGTRIGSRVLVVFDVRGRVVALDPTTGELVTELVVRV